MESVLSIKSSPVKSIYLYLFIYHCYVKLHGGRAQRKRLTTPALQYEFTKGVNIETHLGQQQDDTDILRAPWQVLSGYMWQNRMDRGTRMFPAPGKGEMPYTLTQGRTRAFSRNQYAWGGGEESDSPWRGLREAICSCTDLADLEQRSSSSSQAGSGISRNSVSSTVISLSVMTNVTHIFRNDIYIMYGLIFGDEQQYKQHIYDFRGM